MEDAPRFCGYVDLLVPRHVEDKQRPSIFTLIDLLRHVNSIIELLKTETSPSDMEQKKIVRTKNCFKKVLIKLRLMSLMR